MPLPSPSLPIDRLFKSMANSPRCYALLLFASLIASGDCFADSPKLWLEIPDALATSEDEMKPYVEIIEHTEATMPMVPIRGGTFLMGSPDEEEERKDDEGPQREVTVSPFWMGKYEVTWDQYDVWNDRMDQLRRQMLSLKETPRDLAVDGFTKPTEPYTDMSFGMGRGDFPAICMTQHAARTFLQMAIRQNRTLLPVAFRSGVGVRMPGGNDDGLFVRRRRR